MLNYIENFYGVASQMKIWSVEFRMFLGDALITICLVGRMGSPRFMAVWFQTSGMGVRWKYGTINHPGEIFGADADRTKFTSPHRLLRLQVTGLV